MTIKGENSFVAFLELLKVKYTKNFSNQYFNEHPHKFNLYGLSTMLSDFGVSNVATRIVEKETDLTNIELPFVAHSGGDFVVVYKVDPEKVHCIRNGRKIFIPFSHFIQSWSGVILLAETSPDSIEPGYHEHRKKDLLIIAQKSLLALACIMILGIAYFHNVFSVQLGEFDLPFQNSVLGITSLLLVNLTGVYISYLLVIKQMHIQSRYADKICTLFSKSDCNNVLESDAAKLWGVFGWSEIGLGYFAGNITVLLFLPQLLTFLGIFNILTLPYTVWSVWYQKTKARQWCPLCLIVLVLLWTIFFLNLAFGNLILPDFSVNFLLSLVNCLLSICIYAIPVLLLTLLIPKLSEGNQVEQLRQEINSLKANEELFNTLLKQQPFYEVSKADSQILFGNPEAKLLISILTNPLCNPCALLHARIEKLPREIKEKICIQYIFSAFNESLEYANRSFNAVYMEKGREAAWQLYSAWFEKGKLLKEAFFDDLKLDMTKPAIEVEFQKHESWKEKSQIRATPTILVNGYKLPENYKIEDLRFFANILF